MAFEVDDLDTVVAELKRGSGPPGLVRELGIRAAAPPQRSGATRDVDDAWMSGAP
jgi:hypothetical protein